MTADPLTLKLTARAVRRADGLVGALYTKVRRAAGTGRRASSLLDERLVSAFRFANDERRFARALLARHARFWIFRTHQRGFCGDFVLVDMSARTADRRAAIALDLKQGARLRLGGGGAGNAFVRLSAAIDEIARETGALLGGHEPQRVTGDSERVLEYLAR